MKFVLALLLCLLAVQVIQSEPEKCFDKNEECHSTNYQTYVDCVKRRHKRSTDCDQSCDSDAGNCIDTCGDCDCSTCSYSNCDNTCNSCCSSCCNNYVPCRTNHCCHKTCQAQCKSSNCRSVCRKNCFDTVKQTETIVQSSGNSSSFSYNENRPNITTIIHLNNVINNTNIIDVPISINFTNKNNISLSPAGYNVGGGYAVNGSNCCIVISPRRCVRTNEFPFVRCFHYRSRQCGDYCTASIIHREERQVCQYVAPTAQPECQQQVIYIPQPQPRCSYQSTWPYVSCGIQRSTSCSGCYNHYVNENSQAYVTCPSGCYDDGFAAGPYYRQGPVYRPTYTHTPCSQGDNFGSYGGCAGYGGQVGYGGQFGYGGQGFAPPVNPETPFGSWSPGDVSNFENGSSLNFSAGGTQFDPLINVGPALSNNLPYGNPYRASREVEIEVNYEPASSAQAEVKIRQDETDDIEEDTDKSNEKLS